MNQVIWIIGALSSPGRKLAKHYSALGAKLVLIDTNRDKLYELKQENKGNPMHTHVLASPVSNHDALKSTAEQALRIFDRVDFLFWVSASVQDEVQLDTDRSGAEMDRNFWSFVSLYLLVLRSEIPLKPKHLIALTDVTAVTTNRNKVLDTASKHALRAYVNSQDENLLSGTRLSLVITQPSFDVKQLEKSLSKSKKEILFPGAMTIRLRLLKKLADQFEQALHRIIR